MVDHPTTCGYGHADIMYTLVKEENSLVDAMMEHKRLSSARTYVILGGLLGIDAFTHEPSMSLMNNSDPTAMNTHTMATLIITGSCKHEEGDVPYPVMR